MARPAKPSMMPALARSLSTACTMPGVLHLHRHLFPAGEPGTVDLADGGAGDGGVFPGGEELLDGRAELDLHELADLRRRGLGAPARGGASSRSRRPLRAPRARCRRRSSPSGRASPPARARCRAPRPRARRRPRRSCRGGRSPRFARPPPPSARAARGGPPGSSVRRAFRSSFGRGKRAVRQAALRGKERAAGGHTWKA